MRDSRYSLSSNIHSKPFPFWRFFIQILVQNLPHCIFPLSAPWMYNKHLLLFQVSWVTVSTMAGAWVSVRPLHDQEERSLSRSRQKLKQNCRSHPPSEWEKYAQFRRKISNQPEWLVRLIFFSRTDRSTPPQQRGNQFPSDRFKHAEIQFYHEMTILPSKEIPKLL